MSGAKSEVSLPSPLKYKSLHVPPPIDANIVSHGGFNNGSKLTGVTPTEEEVIIRSSAGRQLEALITLIPPNSDGIDAHALIDSGCTGSCIDSRFVNRYGIPTKRYPNPLRVSNADGTDNEGGLITEYAEVQLVFDDH